MRSILLLALLLPSLAAAEVVTVPTGPRVPVAPTPTTYPFDGFFVYRPDAQCAAQYGTGYVLPDAAKLICMRDKAIEYLTQEVGANRIVPGPAFTACAHYAAYAWPTCVEFYLAARTPEIRLGMSPRWVRGLIGTTPYEGCAAGISYSTWVYVSISDLPRSYRLAAWEPSNVALFYYLDRRDLADSSAVVGAATNYAAAACGVQ